jgi:type 1 glutamine amidotransferase
MAGQANMVRIDNFMKNNMTKLIGCLAVFAVLLGFAVAAQAAPKKLLVVTVTKAYRHSSIETGAKVIEELGKKSGAYTVELVATDEDMAKKMTPEALRNYDGVFFVSSTGDLPLPDKMGLLNWIKSGKGYMGAHAATDAFHGDGKTVDPYIEMLGGEFVTHGTARVTCIVVDTNHPATKGLGGSYELTDEIYSMKNYDPAKVHELLILDKVPGTSQPAHFPISWCKNYGKGKVFYTALGHDDAVWQDPKFQIHLLGGIKWALGLEKGDAKPQAMEKK